MIRKIVKYFFITFLSVGLVVGFFASMAGMYFYFRLTRDLPRIDKLSDYHPRAVSAIYAADGTLMAEVFDQLRYPVQLAEVPEKVRNAFLAAEDANFYNHPGIDLRGIVRAMWVNFHSRASRQGASTITQQVVKALLLTPEKTFERKAKEAILSYRLENSLTKDEIFSIYLNEIYLGNHSYGIKAAARTHFHREMAELSIAECALLAGLPQRPSELMNPKNRSKLFARTKYVLDRMLNNGMITQDEYRRAKEEKITIYPPNLNRLYRAPYYVSHATVVAEEALKKIDRRYTLKYPGGFRIETVADLKANDIAQLALRRGVREIDKRRGWRGPLDAKRLAERSFVDLTRIVPGEIYPATVTQIGKGTAEVKVGAFTGTANLTASWARRFRTKTDDVVESEVSKLLSPGSIIEVSLDRGPEKSANESEKKDGVKKEGEKQIVLPILDTTQKISFVLDQTPEVEAAFAVSNVLTGEVKAIIGGYDYRESEFNRATLGLLQPGSSFKPFIYVAAVDTLGLTPSSLVPDSPISFIAGNGEVWAPHNFDGKFLGPITLRTALQRSRNVVSVYLLNKIGIDRGIQSARNLGISTEIPRNMSISLGTPEVRLIEMVRAYGAFAAGGYLSDSLVVSRILDRDGKVIYEQRPRQKKVLSEETAFIMAHMMEGVVQRGTATSVKPLGKPVAGKTGTTNDHMDAWFIGYTPEWAAGVWTGFDVKKSLGKIETGGKAAAPIFLYFMQEFLKDTPPLDFTIPDGVVPVAVDVNSGRPVNPSSPGAFIEYFKSGTEPIDAAPEAAENYLLNENF